jgi:hypothetical protein
VHDYADKLVDNKAEAVLVSGKLVSCCLCSETVYDHTDSFGNNTPRTGPVSKKLVFDVSTAVKHCVSGC